MLQSIDTCQNKESADQYHVTISRAQVQGSSRSRVFLKLTAAQVLLFSIRSRAHVRIKYHLLTESEVITGKSQTEALMY